MKTEIIPGFIENSWYANELKKQRTRFPAFSCLLFTFFLLIPVLFIGYGVIAGYLGYLKEKALCSKKLCICSQSFYETENDDLITNSPDSEKRFFSAEGDAIALQGVLFDFKKGGVIEDATQNWPNRLSADVERNFNTFSTQVAMSPNGRYLAVKKIGKHSGTVISFYDVDKRTVVAQKKISTGPMKVFITDMAIDNDLTFIMIVTSHGSLAKYDLKANKYQFWASMDWYCYDRIEFSPDGKYYLAVIDHPHEYLNLYWPDCEKKVYDAPVAAILFDTSTDKQVCSLLIDKDNKDWAVITPEGKYDGSQRLLKNLMVKPEGVDTKEKNFKKITDLPEENHIPSPSSATLVGFVKI